MGSTIADVARRASVSTATVSHVINKTRIVSQETTRRVMEAIEELGYSPNASARTLKTGKTMMIGYIVPDISDRFFSTIFLQVESVLAGIHNNLFLANSDETREREKMHIKNLTAGLTDGIIIASSSTSYEEIAGLIPPDFPCCFFDRKPEGCQRDSVTISCHQSMWDATHTLVARGHTRIGYVAGVPGVSTNDERRAAFRAAMEDCGLEVDQRLIIRGDSIAAKTVAAVDALLAQKCTAIVTSNNLMSEQATYHLASLGFNVGRDIDLLVFKDYESYNSSLSNCDTIVQPVWEFGKRIGETMVWRIQNPGAPIREIILSSVFQPKQ